MKSLSLLIICLPAIVFAQYPHVSADDEALGRSSCAWYPSVGALYSNPAAISYVRQTECAVTNYHLFQTTFLGASYFDPSIGTIALGGIRNSSSGTDEDIVSLGFAHEFISSFSLGLTIGGKKIGQTIVPTCGAGFLFRPPGESTLRNLSFGMFLQNVTFDSRPKDLFGGFGAAYWFLNDRLRVQAAGAVDRPRTAVRLGVEGRLLDWLSLRAGTDRGRYFSGGVGLIFPFVHLDAAVEKSFVLLTFTPRIGAAWFEKRDRHFAEGVDLYKQQRYLEAIQAFDIALMYDRDYSPAYEYRSAAESDYLVKVEEYYERGQTLAIKGRYRDAIQMLQAALAINPHHELSRMRLASVEEKLHILIDSTYQTGKRYWNQRQYRQARAMFQRILEFDSTEQSAQDALEKIESERAVIVDSLVHAGEAALRQSLLEMARNAFEKAAAVDPGNRPVEHQLNALKEKLTLRELIEEGKRQLAIGGTVEALSAFRRVLEKDPSNAEAKKYVMQCQVSLKSIVNDLYQEAQHAYSNEEYETAIDLLNRVLTIEPDNKTAQEYYVRANERLKALEQLR